MGTLAPYAVVLGALVTLALLFTAYWDLVLKQAERFGERFESDLLAAGMSITPRLYGLIALGGGGLLWTLSIIALRPKRPIVGLLLVVIASALSIYAARAYLRSRRKKRVAQFQDQFETGLRSIASGIRVGLGIHQAFEMTAKQSRDPLKAEFTRVIGLTNVGMSLLDAFDEMGRRMTNPETAMFARVMRVQSETGGDLGEVLDGLATTIRDRRRLARRVSAITAQGRATGWLLGLLPIGVGVFMVVAEPQLREAMLETIIGRACLAGALVLDGLAVFSLTKIVSIDP